MTTLDRILDFLPPPYTIAPDSVLAALLGAFALEVDALQEDIDRVRRTHWIRQAYQMEDAQKLGALVGLPSLPWETLETYRARLLPLVAAQLDGALGPEDIRRFVHDYLRNAEAALESTLVPHMPPDPDDAYRVLAGRPQWHPLALAENPPRLRRSNTLVARGGAIPYLFRWTETNNGLDETVPAFRVTGLPGRRTAVPVLVNLTTGEMILYADRLLAGSELEISTAGEASRAARATLNGFDITHKLRSMSGFALGTPFTQAQFDRKPLLPRLMRGTNDWIFLAIGLFDVRGLNQVFFALPDATMREVTLDETAFDHALFPSGPLVQLAMEWTETEPASFEVQIPRTVVLEPSGSLPGASPHELVADALQRSIDKLHAAGVRAALRFMPFAETQRQIVRHTLPWVVLDPETAPTGQGERMDVGGRFGETDLGHARFE